MMNTPLYLPGNYNYTVMNKCDLKT